MHNKSLQDRKPPTELRKAMGLSGSDLIELEKLPLANPQVGDVIQGTGGARKMRISLDGSGKSGGGRVIHNDDAYYDEDSDYPYCRDCYDKIDSEAIKSYSHKPEPIFYGSGVLFMGVNLENYHTIEFRIFRGTLRYKTFLATLQLVNEICRFAIQLDDKRMERLSWSEFMSPIPTDKPELIEYLKSKRLYINEAAEESEEM